MNDRKNLVLIALILITAVALTLVWPRTSRNDGEQAVSVQVSAPESSKPTANPVSKINTNPFGRIVAPVRKAVDAIERKEKIRAGTLAKNVPIDFYGKVVDQAGVPVSGVSVTAASRSFVVGATGEPLAASFRTNLVTENDGTFQINGIMGDALTLEAVEKKGYEHEPGALRTFLYNAPENFTANSANPIVFRIWESGTHAALLTGDKVFKFTPDGRSYAVDFASGAIGEAHGAEGDLQFLLKRPNDAKHDAKYDWAFKITLPDGEVLEEAGTQYADMQLAPTDGYAKTYDSTHRVTDGTWAGWEWNKRLFVKLHGGQSFGRIQLSVDPFFDKETGQGRLHIEYAVNPRSPVLR